MEPSLRRTLAIVVVVGMSMLTPLCTYAQTTPDEEELRLRSRQDAEERARRQQAPDVRLTPPSPAAAVAPLPKEAICFIVHEIRLSGTHLEAFPWTQSYLDRYRGQCVGEQGLNLILKGLTEKFIAKGYITTRVLLPQQDLSKGSLRILLVPGMVGEIRFSTVDAPTLWRSAFPLRPGDLLNLRDIEQGLEQLKRIPSQDVNFKIVPGKRQGESDIVIDIKRTKPWRVVLSVDDAGTRPTGKLQGAVTAFLDNPFDLNDIITVSLNGDVEKKGDSKGTRGDSVSYSIPWGYWTSTLASSVYEYHQTIQGSTQSFVSSGVMENNEITLNRVVVRDRVSKTALQFRVVKRRNRSYIDDTEVAVQRREVTSAELALLYRRYFGRAQLDASLAYRQGVSWFGAQREPSNPSPGQPTTRYKIQTLDVGFVAPLSDGDAAVRYSGSFRAQTTDDYLYTSEFFSIGNRYTVRGFDGEQTLAAERGWYLRNEIDIPLPAQSQTFYMGIDHGEVAGPTADQLIGTTLTGAVLGLRGGASGFAFDVFAGWVIDKPKGFVTDHMSVGGQLSYQF